MSHGLEVDVGVDNLSFDLLLSDLKLALGLVLGVGLVPLGGSSDSSQSGSKSQ